jgi:hypothetical protein
MAGFSVSGLGDNWEIGYRRNQDNGTGFLKFNLDTKKEKGGFFVAVVLIVLS